MDDHLAQDAGQSAAIAAEEVAAEEVQGAAGIRGALPSPTPPHTGPIVQPRRHRLARPIAVAIFPALHAVAAVYRLGSIERNRRRFAAAGPGLDFEPTKSAFSYELIEIGRDVGIGPGAYLYGPMKIGNDV